VRWQNLGLYELTSSLSLHRGNVSAFSGHRDGFGYYKQARGLASVLVCFIRPPGGHLKFPHPWPGQNPPPDSSGTRTIYAL